MLFFNLTIIPEGFEAIFILSYSHAISNIVKDNTIIQELPTIETLGIIFIIYSNENSF